jgi:hypothetical protein
VPTLSINLGRDAAMTAVWRDGALLEDCVRRRAMPLVAVGDLVRVTPESPAHPAGWATLEQAVATLFAVYGLPLPFEYDGDPEDVAVLFRRASTPPGLPEPV